MNQVIVSRIRPVSWKICVQGLEGMQYLRSMLRSNNIETDEPEQEPELQDPPVYSITARLTAGEPMVAPELTALLQQDERIELVFED